jgi:hypothetical protein
MHSRRVKAGVLLLVSYVLLYLVYLLLDFLPKWDGYGLVFFLSGDPAAYRFVDPLFWFIPLVGFMFSWLSVSWYLRHFKDESVLSIPYALGFVLVSYVVFFIAMVGYYWNNAFLTAMVQGKPSPGWMSLGPTISFVVENFLDALLQSAYFLFILAALLGWASYVVVHSYWREKLPHLH